MNFHGPPAARMRGIRRAIVRDDPPPKPVESKKKAAAKPKAKPTPKPTPEPTPEPVRARDDDGHFVPDDPATPDVNEAFVGGKPLKPEWDDGMTKAELLEVVEGKGLEGLSMSNTKKQLLEALEGAER
jgi:hypothetical protein